MYERIVITTKKRESEPPASEPTFTRDQVEAVSDGLREPAWLRERRLAAWEAFRSLPLPTLQDEAWRRTDIRPLKWGRLGVATLNGRLPARRVPAALRKPLVGKQHGGLLLMQGDRVEASELDQSIREKGVIFTNLATAAREHGEIVRRYLGKAVPPTDGKFAALAQSLAGTGVFVYVPKGVEVHLPLHAVMWMPVTEASIFTHVLIAVDDGAQVTYVHESASPRAEGQALHAGTVEILLGDAAHLKIVELQSWGDHVWNFTHERARLGRDSSLDWIFGAMGTHLTKSFMEVDLDGEGATARMSGLYFADGVQHLDHDTQQNHNAPHATSDFLFKGALKDRSRSVWQGMIYVAPGAQKTDGYQANRNLVLSKQARADSIPGLEILADDVRCTHGATVGQLEAEHIFYLMARGLSRPEAERLVVDGFFEPVMQRIPFAGVRRRLQKAIESKMGPEKAHGRPRASGRSG